VLDAQSRPKEIWVRWHQVPDFYASGPRDRHYVVDRLSGEIRFGDGLNGLVPPTGVGNVRMPSYQTGGGSNGNRPAGVIVQLKTTVPYVDKVTNHEPAAGGANAEPVESLLDRVPRAVRHGGRAVTVEDYEDLARLATAEVARALCVPLANLAVDPLLQAPANPGDVSVIVVPISSEAKPLPSLELIRRVQDSLDRVHVSTATLSVVGPLYVRVDVSAEVALVSLEGATRVLADVQHKVASFLHPLTGGLDGTGWDFGRRPHDSDFYALIEAVPGVDHIRALDVVEVEDMPGVTDTGRFLVYSGTPNISVIFEEE
jgi:predicted phage baseplate assembly protein